MSDTPDPKMQVNLLCHAVLDGEVQRVREMLAAGCPTSHPLMGREPLQLALEKGHIEIIDALVDAGARIAQEEFIFLIRPQLRAGRTDVAEHALRRGAVGQHEMKDLFFAAISAEHENLALILLQLGANPLATHQVTPGWNATAFECAAQWTSDGFPKLVPAMLRGMTLAQKNELLVDQVRRGRTAAVRHLLASGADPHLEVDGMPLIEHAPDFSEDIRRLLRAIDTTEAIEAAMGADEAPPVPASANSSFTL